MTILPWQWLRNSLLELVKLATNSDPDKYFYSGYCILFDVCGSFSLLNGGFSKNVIIFGGDVSPSVYIDNKKGIFRQYYIDCRSWILYYINQTWKEI